LELEEFQQRHQESNLKSRDLVFQAFQCRHHTSRWSPDSGG
jgi:hypothetical protein